MDRDPNQDKGGRILGRAGISKLQEAFDLSAADAMSEVEKNLDSYCFLARSVEHTTEYFRSYAEGRHQFQPSSNFVLMKRIDTQDDAINSVPLVVSLYQDHDQWLSGEKAMLVKRLKGVNSYYLPDNTDVISGGKVIELFDQQFQKAYLHAKFLFAKAFVEHGLMQLSNLSDDDKREYIRSSSLLSALSSLDGLSMYIKDPQIYSQAETTAIQCKSVLEEFLADEVKGTLSRFTKKS